MSKKIGVLGSGKVGEVLADGFLKHGYSVMRASREPKKLESWKAGAKGEASIGNFADAAKWADIVVLAVKGSGAEPVIDQIGAALAGKIVIDATNPIADAPPKNGVLQYFTKMNESLMERLQQKAPNARFVKAFNQISNPVMVNPKLADKPTMFICGNDDGAKKETTAILDQFGWETFDCGKAEAAGPIESLCTLFCIPGMLKNDWVHAIKYVRAG
jgi:predicted dinucleotide-binding enzyme